MKKTFLNTATITTVGESLLILRNEIFNIGDIDYIAYLILLRSETAFNGGSIKKLKRELPVSSKNVDTSVSYLLDKSLVYKDRDSLDRRGFMLRCTARGSDLVRYIDPTLTGLLQYHWSFVDESILLEFIKAIEPFSKSDPQEFLPPNTDISYQFLTGIASLWREYMEFTNESSLTTAEFHLLIHLKDEGPTPLETLRSRLHYFTPSLRMILLHLANKEMVDFDSTNESSAIASLTPLGRDRIENAFINFQNTQDIVQKKTPQDTEFSPKREGELINALHQICLLAYGQWKPPQDYIAFSDRLLGGVLNKKLQ